MRKNCTIKFYLHDRIRGTRRGFPIYGRITYQRKKAHFATGEYCKSEEWDKKSGLPVKDPHVKQYLVYLESKIYDIKNQLDIQKKEVSAVLIRDILRNGFEAQEKKKIKLLEYFDKHIDRISKLNQEYALSKIMI